MEVSDSSLSYDRNQKAHLYAAFGILDYWIVNLVDGQLEIRRDPHLEGMKIYAVSGTSQKRFDLQTGPGGVDRWFTKPVDPRELVRQIDCELAALHPSE